MRSDRSLDHLQRLILRIWPLHMASRSGMVPFFVVLLFYDHVTAYQEHLTGWFLARLVLVTVQMFIFTIYSISVQVIWFTLIMQVIGSLVIGYRRIRRQLVLQCRAIGRSAGGVSPPDLLRLGSPVSMYLFHRQLRRLNQLNQSTARF